MNPFDLDAELVEWPWWLDPMFWGAVLIIGVAVWWVWSGRAPH